MADAQPTEIGAHDVAETLTYAADSIALDRDYQLPHDGPLKPGMDRAETLLRRMADSAHESGLHGAPPSQLQAAARRGLDALAMLILDNPDPGTEALGAQYELRQALIGQAPEFPAIRVWQIQAQRRDGSWNNYSAPIVDEAEAHADFAETLANSGHTRAFRLVCSMTTQIVEAVHAPEEADGA